MKDGKTIRYTVQYINEILKYFGMEINYIQPKGKHKNENSVYQLKTDIDIREIIQYKIEKGNIIDLNKKIIKLYYSLDFNNYYTPLLMR